MKIAIVVPLALLAFMPGMFAQSSSHAETIQIGASTAPVTVTAIEPELTRNAPAYKLNISGLDTNEDGELSRREISVSQALADEFHLVDVNHNGYITDAELEKVNGR